MKEETNILKDIQGFKLTSFFLIISYLLRFEKNRIDFYCYLLTNDRIIGFSTSIIILFH